MALASYAIKRQPQGFFQLPITSTKHDHLIQQLISCHVLTISHHNKPSKNKLDVLYFVVVSFTWLLRASSKNCSYLRIETTMIFRQVCCFNLQQGPGVVTLGSTKVRQTDTRRSPLSNECSQRWNQSRVSVRVMSVRAASSHNAIEQKYDMLVSSMTYIAHNSLVFYSCIASTHKTRLGCHCWGT